MGVVYTALGAPLQEPEVGRESGKDWELIERKDVLLWQSGLGTRERAVGGCRGKDDLLRTQNLETECIFFLMSS